MRRRDGRQARISFFGYLLFFVTIAAVVTCAVLLYSFVSAESGGDSRWIAGVMLAVIFVLALLCTVFDAVRRKLMVERPVRKILDATRRITEGDFSVRLEPRHAYNQYDSYDLIMEDLNKMAAELSKTEVLRTDFISNVSHELKTPLSVIQNYAMAMQSDKLDEGTRKKYAETLVSASKRLTELIVNILRLNKLDNQEILADVEPIALGEAVREAVLQFEEPIDEKRLELECDIDDLTIRSSPSYLEIVWNNLLSNAVKFTDQGGRIRVSVKEEDGYAVVRVSDDGCGISSETGAHIFDKFYQGDTSHSQEGNGLGLALVKKVIDILGGEIRVDSVLGEGSTFTVKLKKEDA